MITANYTFLNDSLAALYQIPGITGTQHRKVNLPQSSKRQGLLGHASILTATANGVETSPVLRGIWVLKSLLGTPPAPPPPDVPPIEPDTRGAKSIRDQLEKHREVESCADCHANIDPWGFTLENFGPIGEYRSHYPILKSTGKVSGKQGLKIDSSGTSPQGEEMKDASSLRKTLLQSEDKLTRNLIQKLLTYGIGRELTYQDFPEVNEMTEKALDQNMGMRDILIMTLKSRVFNRR